MDNGMLPPDGGPEPVTPESPAPFVPPAGEVPPVGMPTAGMPPGSPPLMAPKPKLKAWFVVLGLATPWAVLVCQGFLLSALSSSNFAGSLVGATAGLLNTGVFVAILVAFLVGRGKEDARLRSFGVGGLISYGIMMLIALLAFGTCLITLGNQ